MVKLTGPCLSLEARGGLGRALTYRHIAGRATVGRWLAPPYRNTPAQKSIRRYSLWLQQQWASISAPNKATWTTTAKGKAIANYHAYLSQNMTRWQSLLPPTQIDGAPGLAPFSPDLSFAAYNSPGNRAYMQFFFSGLDFQTVTSFVRTDLNTPTRNDFLMQLYPGGAANEMIGVTDPFPNGTYQFWAYSGSLDGEKHPIIGPTALVIP